MKIEQLELIELFDALKWNCTIDNDTYTWMPSPDSIDKIVYFAFSDNIDYHHRTSSGPVIEFPYGFSRMHLAIRSQGRDGSRYSFSCCTTYNASSKVEKIKNALDKYLELQLEKAAKCE